MVRDPLAHEDPVGEERRPELAAERRAQREPVEERRLPIPDRHIRKTGEARRERVRASDPDPRGCPQRARTHEREVDGRGDRRDRLVGADVGRRLLAADVLLPGLERVHEAPGPVRVDGLPDDPTRHLPHQRVAATHDPEVRPAERERDAKRLPFADDDVDPECARRLEERVRMRLGDLHAEPAGGVRGLGDRADVDERAEGVGVLDDEACGARGVRGELARRDRDDLELRSFRVRRERLAEL